MTEHEKPATSGTRSLRIEAGGPTATELLAEVARTPPSELAGESVQRLEPGRNGGIVVHLDGAELSVEAGGGDAEVRLSGSVVHASSDTASRRRLVALLDALTSAVSDPERRAFITRLADSPDHGASDDVPEIQAPGSLDRSAALALVVRSIDLTTLAGDDTPGRIRALCSQARSPDPTDPAIGPVAAVCVYPNLVATAVELTTGTGVKVASVASAFPSGQSSLAVRLLDIEDVVAAGADEVDVVINRNAFLRGDHETVAAELHAMRTAVGGRAMKVILETSELARPQAIAAAAELAIAARADWIKTSTGKSPQGATPEAVSTMCAAVARHVEGGGDPVGIKVSGGVRSGDEALRYLAIIEAILGPAWLTPDRVRFGASGLLGAVVAELRS